MPYIYEYGIKDDLIEVFGYEDGSISIDSRQEHYNTEIRMSRQELKNLVGVLQDWLNATWGK